MNNSFQHLAEVLAKVPSYIIEDKVNKNIVAELARKYDAELLNTLLGDKVTAKLFFTKTDAGMIFKRDIFLQFISEKEFLPESYTAYEQKIGLASGGEMLAKDARVVLSWPYKDCVLEGGQDTEDAKRDEVFFNEVLAPDEITTLLDDKVFVNWKRYDKDGEHELDELKPDDNLVIKGNNLLVLHSLKKRFAGRVKLIYIDPPYNTDNDSFGYNDRFKHSTWLTFMKNRLSAAKDLLAQGGCIAIQIDDNRQAYLKVLCDELFEQDNHVATIALKMSTASGVKLSHKYKTILKEKEYILLYRKGEIRVNPEYIPAEWDDEYSYCLLGKETGKYEVIKLKALLEQKGIGYNPKSEEFKEFVVKNADIIWRRAFIRGEMKKKSMENPTEVIVVGEGADKKYYYGGRQMFFFSEKFHEYYDENKKCFGPSNLLCDFWADINTSRIFNEGDVHLQNGKKAEQIIARLVRMFTDEGDIVMDYHLGSGTTAAVAHKMNRQYIGVEQLDYGDNGSIMRLQNVINGDSTGISKAVGWQGGGSFVTCEIKNDANDFRERVKEADESNIADLLTEVLKSSFLSYRVDPKKVSLPVFQKLSLADQKHVLLDLIDNNTLYLNYSEIDDQTYNISEEDKKHNRAFYKEVDKQDGVEND